MPKVHRNRLLARLAAVALLGIQALNPLSAADALDRHIEEGDSDLLPSPADASTAGLFRTVELTLPRSAPANRRAAPRFRLSPRAAEGQRRAKAAQSSRAKPDVFGSVALPFQALPIAARWRAILSGDPGELIRERCSQNDQLCPVEFINQLSATVSTSSRLAPKARLQHVNAMVNASLRYRSDNQVYGVIDHWATFSEVLKYRSGDCEDFALLKMWLLRAAGVPLESMYLVVLRDTRRNVYHAVLAVDEGDGAFILDNVETRIYRDRYAAAYVPIYSLGARGTWIHGFRSKPSGIAEAPFHPIYPGEAAAHPSAGAAPDYPSSAGRAIPTLKLAPNASRKG